MSVNKKRLPLVALVLAVIFIVSMFAGCGLKTTNDPVVLKVGNVKMRLSEYTSLYNTYYSYYTTYGLYDVSTTEKLYAFQDMVYNMLINSAVELYQTDLNNITLDETEMATAQTSADNEMENLLDTYKKEVDSSITDEAAIKEAAMKLMKAELRKTGYTYDSYREYVLDSIVKTMRVEKQSESIKSGVTVADEKVVERYNTELANDKATYTDSPSQYYTDNYYWTMYNEGIQPLYIPAGYIQVKRIYLKADTEQAKIDEVAQAIKAGNKTFDELIKEYSSDVSGSLYLVSEGVADEYSDGFADAALKLKNVGDVSDAVKAEDGTYFIRLEAKLKEGPIALEGEVKTNLQNTMLTEAQNMLYDEKLTEWVKNAPVKEYKYRIRHIGAGSGN